MKQAVMLLPLYVFMVLSETEIKHWQFFYSTSLFSASAIEQKD